MEKRFVTFLVLSFVVLSVNMLVMRWMLPQQPAAQQEVEADEKNADDAAKPEAPAEGAPALAAGDADKPAEQPAAEKPADAVQAGAQPAAAEADVPEQRYTLGSVDPASGYRVLATFVNRGAALERVELASPRYLDQEDRSGYIGQLDLTVPTKQQPGALVRVVGAGTPAAEAGVKAGDVITIFNGERVLGPIEFHDLLEKTDPGHEFKLIVERDGANVELTGTLRRRPMEVTRPEALDPLSFLLTLDSVDGQRIAKDADELPGIKMRTTNWQVLPQNDPEELSFQCRVPEYDLEVIKKFRLAKVDPAEAENEAAAAYHLAFSIEVRNTGEKERKVAWRLDGPTGLPLEGSWYAFKISPNWRGGAGMRDVVVGLARKNHTKQELVSTFTISEDEKPTTWMKEPIDYLAVDAQYFSVALLPEENDRAAYDRAYPIRAGEVPADRAKINRTNVSFRLISDVTAVEPKKSWTQSYRIFSGPKKPSLLAKYGLGQLVYYGMFGWVAEPMLMVLHTFYRVIPNYGIAIIMLTVLVRSMMFPLSRRQTLNAQKMQELQPEIKRLTEKYKGNMEARSKAQQELFKKHNYNPLAGCLPLFLQLPIFMGLYRSLSVDVELRGAPLISEAIRWCSNLAAPDMLWYWQPMMPAMLASPGGWLGPYFNLFPCISAGLFIWQQKKLMPPPADEQAAMQQKVMQYMTVMMGVMFFKVASGLCLYLISSSIWSMAERKLLPKPVAPAGGSPPGQEMRTITIPPSGGGNGASGGKKKKNRGRA